MLKELLVCSMLLSPLGITEQEDRGKVMFKLPNGFGINNITVIVPIGQEENGRREAQILFDTLHKVHTWYINKGDVVVTLKESTYEKELDELIHFANVLGIQNRIRSIDSSL